MKDLEFHTIGIEEKKLLLTALGYKTKNLTCMMCKKRIPFAKVGIMPPLKSMVSPALIICDCPLCMAEYLTEFESENERRRTN